MFTAGSAWVVDMAPEERRGRMIGLYGLAIWTGPDARSARRRGPPARRRLQPGLGLRRGAPPLAALIASRPARGRHRRGGSEPARPAHLARGDGPGCDLLARRLVASRRSRRSSFSPSTSAGSATAPRSSACSPRRSSRRGSSAAAFPTASAPRAAPLGAALVESVGLSCSASPRACRSRSPGRSAMGAAFSLLFPALSLLAVNRVAPERRGAAMGTFTASFDLGMLVGSPVVGAARRSAATRPPSTWRPGPRSPARRYGTLHSRPGGATGLRRRVRYRAAHGQCLRTQFGTNACSRPDAGRRRPRYAACKPFTD